MTRFYNELIGKLIPICILIGLISHVNHYSTRTPYPLSPLPFKIRLVEGSGQRIKPVMTLEGTLVKFQIWLYSTEFMNSFTRSSGRVRFHGAQIHYKG